MTNETKVKPKKTIWKKWWVWVIVVFVIIIIVSAGGGKEEPVSVVEEKPVVVVEEEKEIRELLDMSRLVEMKPYDAINAVVSEYGEPFPEGLIEELKKSEFRSFGAPVWFVDDYSFQISFYSDNTYAEYIDPATDVEPFYVDSSKRSLDDLLESFNLEREAEAYILNVYEYDDVPGGGVGIIPL